MSNSLSSGNRICSNPCWLRGITQFLRFCLCSADCIANSDLAVPDCHEAYEAFITDTAVTGKRQGQLLWRTGLTINVLHENANMKCFAGNIDGRKEYKTIEGDVRNTTSRPKNLGEDT